MTNTHQCKIKLPSRTSGLLRSGLAKTADEKANPGINYENMMLERSFTNNLYHAMIRTS